MYNLQMYFKDRSAWLALIPVHKMLFLSSNPEERKRKKGVLHLFRCYTHIYIYIHMCMYLNMCMYMYIYIYLHVHIYAYTGSLFKVACIPIYPKYSSQIHQLPPEPCQSCTYVQNVEYVYSLCGFDLQYTRFKHLFLDVLAVEQRVVRHCLWDQSSIEGT